MLTSLAAGKNDVNRILIVRGVGLYIILIFNSALKFQLFFNSASRNEKAFFEKFGENKNPMRPKERSQTVKPVL